LRGIYLGIGPDHPMAGAYAEGDRAFAQAEMSATLLAAINHPGVIAFNRFSPAAWFERGSWPAWRGLLRAAGVPVAKLTFGGVHREGLEGRWLPYGGIAPTRLPGEKLSRVLGMAIIDGEVQQGCLCVCAEVVSAAAPDAARLAAKVLNEEGIGLARVWTDASGCVVSVDCWPEVAPGEETVTTIDLIARRFD
jgi:hypothetical protein